MPTLYVTIGIPGSGKSRWAQTKTDAILVSTDAIRQELCGNITDQTRNAEVFDVAHAAIRCHLLAGHNVVFDATNLRGFNREVLLKTLPPCDRVAVVFPCDAETAKARVRADIRDGKNRSDVPDHAIERMARLFAEEVSETALLAEGFDEIIYIQ